jgi:putative ABC transport system permease protein
MRFVRLLIPRPWRDAVVRDLEDEARAKGRGAFWLAGQLLRVGLRLQPIVNGDCLRSDLRYAIAALWRSKAFALGAILTFALGIGVNVAVFSVVDRMMIRPLPYGDTSTLVVMGEHGNLPTPFETLAASQVIETRLRHQGIVDLATTDPAMYYRATASGEGPLLITEASANLLSVLGVRPWLGRGLTEDDARDRRRGVVLSYEAWQTHFGGRADVLGQNVWRFSEPVEVVGVLPKNFYPPPTEVAGRSDGLGLSLQALQAPNGPNARESRPYVRLKPGVSIAAAEAELNALLGAVKANDGTPITSVFRLMPIREAMFGRYATYSRLVILAAGLVLLMCCANLVSLMLVRARARQYDVAIHMAMGASRSRVLRSLVLESLVLAGAGAAVALIAVTAAHRALLAFVPEIFSRYAEAPTDARVLAFSIVATLVCAVGAGVGPGLRATSKSVAAVLQHEGRGRGGSRQRRGGGAVLVAEAMVAALLVTGAVLTARSLVGLIKTDVGFEPDGLHFVSAFLDPAPKDTGARFKIQLDVLDAIRNTKDVRYAAAADVLPIQGAFGNLFVKGVPGAYTWRVTDAFFETMEMRLRAGRPFTADEVRTGARVAVLGESGLRLVWPGVPAAEAIGRVLSLEGLTPAEIVGVVADIRGEPAATPHASLYLPLTAEGFRGMRFIARTAAGTSVPAEDLRTRITAFAKPIHVAASPVSGRLWKSLTDDRFRATLFGVFAAAALLLAGVGLYAVTAFDVRQRRVEIGIRLALGATRHRVLAHILRDAVWPVALGSMAGLVVAWWAGTFLQSFLHQVDARAPGTLVMVGTVLVVTAVVAAWIPARRASRVDPATVLRAD